ncbi:MAG TPA: xanthine dehydrogenase family protein molybdopterin-binding subunit [Rugosimonospora sp.]|nr:xanthine dehydrogenase family protein molybdopterin-binding subunit [Rugosimonospora sp.]
MSVIPRAVGTPLVRLDGPDKVRGGATYAYEWLLDRPAYLYPVQSTIAAGRVLGVDAFAAAAQPGVVAVLTHDNAPPLAVATDPELAVLHTNEIGYRGQIVAAVIADTLEAARDAARLVEVSYEDDGHDTRFSADRADLAKPVGAAFFGEGAGELQAGAPADTATGDVDTALAAAEVTLDTTYTTTANYHNPMEPHTAAAVWDRGGLTVYLSTQGASHSRDLIARVVGLDPRHVRVIAPHVGGAFGAKVRPHGYAVLAALASRALDGRPVKFALTRQQMFSLVGYRPPTIQRIRLGADRTGRLTAIAHDVVEQSAKVKQYAEQTAACTRMMYAAPARRTTHRLAPLDVPVPTIMRAPGEAQGMFALESAMDEMALECGLDPVEFRLRNEPDRDPGSGQPFSSRGLVACLREGAHRFGWAGRDPVPRAHHRQGWLAGTGVAAATYPSPRLPGTTVTIRRLPGGRYAVLLAAADLGTGTWTALTQIAADALGTTVDGVDLRIGDSALPDASVAGGSSGITSWGASIVEAARVLRGRAYPEATVDMPENPAAERYAMHTFGAQFAEVYVREDSGEVRVRRLLGVFDAGRIVNPRTARSQLVGGMAQGISMALHEHAVRDPRFGHVVNHDLAGYHIASNADVGAVEAYCLDACDPYTNPLGTKGVGEVGVVGTAAAIANAAYHATGVRVRDLPITLDKLR